MSGEFTLSDLGLRIEASHRAAYSAARTALEHAAECGRLLVQAKSKVRHGEWLDWLAANTTVGARQAQRYMRLAAKWDEVEVKCVPETHLTLKGAIALLAEPKDEFDGPKPSAHFDAALEILEGMKSIAQAAEAGDVDACRRIIESAKLAKAHCEDAIEAADRRARLPDSQGEFILRKLHEIDPRIRVHRTGLDLPPDLTFEQWCAVGRVLPHPPEGWR